MKKSSRFFVFLILLSVAIFLSSACAPEPPPTMIPGMAQTLAVRTLVATMGFRYVASATPTPVPATPTPENPSFVANLVFDTPTPVPSLTPIQSSYLVQTEDEACRNKAEFIQDVTIPDGTEFKPGTFFRKTWKIKNVGTCIWTPGYKLVFVFGDRMNGMSPKPLGVTVLPGETIDLSVDLVAPKNPDLYRGNWMLEDEKGEQFGTGLGKEDVFWVVIWVSKPNLGNIFGGCGGGG